MLKIKDISFSYSQQLIFANFSYQLHDHQITTFIGPNGSGKSTLFKLFTRSIKPEQGAIYLNHKDIWQIRAKDFAKKVAIVHQQNTLYDEISVQDLVRMGRLPYGEDQKNKVDKILTYLELDSIKDKFVSELSGGQQQRVWLALALAQEPDYLFLDEPTTYLDLHFQYYFLKLLKKLNHDQHLTICMILHDLNQVLQISDQVVLLNKGKIIKQGKPEQVITTQNISTNFQINCELLQTKNGPILRQF